jgi:protein ImuB
VDRLACIDVPALPLQLLLRVHPQWVGRPVAVVDEDVPQGMVLWHDETARQAGIRRGLRYAAALGLCSELRAGVVDAKTIAVCVASWMERLRRFTPGVEPCSDEPGVFWLDGRGLRGHYRTPRAWVEALGRESVTAGWTASIVCGFDKFATYAVAKALAGRDGAAAKGVSGSEADRAGSARVVFATPQDETAALQRVPLDRVGLGPGARDTLAKLGVRTVGAFVRLPAAGLLRRFDRATYRLHRMATGQFALPPQAEQEIEPVCAEADLDPPELDIERLTFRIKQMLDPLLDRLEREGRALATLELQIGFDGVGAARGSPAVAHLIRPAAPTLDAVQLLGLVRLWLEATPLPSGVAALVLAVEPTPARHEQLSLFVDKPKRDRVAAARAFARLRAALGDDAVGRVRLTDGHLPEARFAWERIDRLATAALEPRRDLGREVVAGNVELGRVGGGGGTNLVRERVAGSTVLVRRVYTRPLPLPSRPPQEPDGWLLCGLDQGPVARFTGPYVVSGAWWRNEIHREYYVAEMRQGDLLWVYYDRPRRQWFLQGLVE